MNAISGHDLEHDKLLQKLLATNISGTAIELRIGIDEAVSWHVSFLFDVKEHADLLAEWCEGVQESFKARTELEHNLLKVRAMAEKARYEEQTGHEDA